MPPRKSNSLLGARRGGRQEKPIDEEELSNASRSSAEDAEPPPAADEEWEAPPGRMTGEHEAAEVPAPIEDEPLPELDDDDELSALQADGDRDIYGEDDFPEDEGDSAPHSSDELQGAVRPRSRTETRVAAVQVPGDEDEGLPEEVSAAAARFRFEITAGPDQGKDVRFRGVRIVVGRTQGCNLKLSDGSVSRRHVELVLGENGVMLRDLGSGNGTKVNGVRVTEKQLEHHDEVSLGKTKLRFIDEEVEKNAAREARLKAPPRTQQETKVAGVEQLEEHSAVSQTAGPEGTKAADPAPEGAPAAPEADDPSMLPAAPGDSTDVGGRALAMPARLASLPRAIALALAAAVILTVGGGIYVVTRPAETSAGPKRAAALKRLDEAKVAYEAGRYRHASSLVDQAEYLSPGVDANGLGAAVKRDLAAEEAMAMARELLENKKYDEALAAIGPVKEIGERLAPQFEELSASIAAQRADWLEARWEYAMENGDVAEARALFAQLPPELKVALRTRMSAFEKNVQQMTAIESEEAAAESARERRRAKERREQAILAALSGVSRKFHAGEFDRALLECDRVADAHGRDAEVMARAAELRKLIPQFARSYQDGERKRQVRNLELAQKAYKKARDTYVAMRLPGPLGRTLDDALVSTNVAVANAALKKGGNEELRKANQLFRDALSIRPSEAEAQNGVDRVVQRAEKLIVEAFVVRAKDREEAALKLKLVMELMPPKSATYRKAKEHLSALEL